MLDIFLGGLVIKPKIELQQLNLASLITNSVKNYDRIGTFCLKGKIFLLLISCLSCFLFGFVVFLCIYYSRAFLSRKAIVMLVSIFFFTYGWKVSL